MPVVHPWIAALSLAAAVAPDAGFVWFGHGEVLYPAGDFSEAMRSMAPVLGDSRPAWKCSHVTVLGAALWSWDCQLVASHPEVVAWAPMPAEIEQMAAQETPLSLVRRSGWNRFGGLLVLGLPVLLAAALMSRRRRR